MPLNDVSTRLNSGLLVTDALNRIFSISFVFEAEFCAMGLAVLNNFSYETVGILYISCTTILCIVMPCP